MAGPAQGLVKRFFYPGFTPRTGGLVRERDLAQRQAAFDRAAWLQGRGLPTQGERLVSLFCYEPPALAELLDRLAASPQPTRLLVTAGRAQAAVQNVVSCRSGAQPSPLLGGSLSISYLPLLTQPDYDHLLWACDLNFVRGEDSVVRALWAGQPFVWQIYPQEDDAHHAKLLAFLDSLQPPASLRAFHLGWNGVATAPPLPMPEPASWAPWARQVRNRLQSQPELVTQLVAVTRAGL